MKEKNKNKGISMIVVLWIMAILTVLTTATALMTQGDITSTVNLIKRKGALQLAESGSDYFIALIPDNSMITSRITDDDSMRLGRGSYVQAVHRVYMSNDSTRSFVVAPVPMVYSNAYGNNPYGPVSPGGSGSYYVYDFEAGGLMGKKEEVESPQVIVEVAAGWWSPLSESAFGHTMY
ncbi:pilus assembly PilX N-terminal domain-containing protein [candidate division WOR-3 bacterium]|nr:pilus assembly PilX N-terminal domain-containing protein [candidate division WOR-3 bacterium]